MDIRAKRPQLINQCALSANGNNADKRMMLEANGKAGGCVVRGQIKLNVIKPPKIYNSNSETDAWSGPPLPSPSSFAHACTQPFSAFVAT